MIYPIKRTHNKNRWFQRLGLTALVVLLGFLFRPSADLNLWAKDFFKPVIQTGGYFYQNIPYLGGFFKEKNALLQEKQRLTAEVEQMLLNQLELEILRYENQELRETINLRPREVSMASTVIARAPQIPLNSLLIDMGSVAGVREGDWILARDGVLIGSVQNVSANTSTVTLTSFPGKITKSFVVRTEEVLDIEGAGGGGAKARVPIDFDIKVGDRVAEETLGLNIIAVVQVIEENRSSGFKNVLMSLPIDVSKLRIVFIRANPKE